MSNYPPGVTGHEPQVAGYDERDATRAVSCTNDECARFEIELDADGTDFLLSSSREGNEIQFDWECLCCHVEQSIDLFEDPRDY